jgi:hypothetical protein
MRNIIFLIPILLFSCNQKNNENVVKEEPIYQPPKITGTKYFEYDELIHYYCEIGQDQLKELDLKPKKSHLDSLKKDVITNYIPKSINDTTFINELQKIGYSKTEIRKDKFDEINKIFIEKKHEEIIGYACDYIFRDILIFKRKSKTIGIAKICFGCNANQIVGTKANTEEFGMDGDYEKLREILERK